MVDFGVVESLGGVGLVVWLLFLWGGPPYVPTSDVSVRQSLCFQSIPASSSWMHTAFRITRAGPPAVLG